MKGLLRVAFISIIISTGGISTNNNYSILEEIFSVEEINDLLSNRYRESKIAPAGLSYKKTNQVDSILRKNNESRGFQLENSKPTNNSLVDSKAYYNGTWVNNNYSYEEYYNYFNCYAFAINY